MVSDQLEAVALGAGAFVSKPVPLEQLARIRAEANPRRSPEELA